MRLRFIRAMLTLAGWLGRWLIRKLGRLGVARLEAWIEGEIDKFDDRAKGARGERRRRWYLWRSRLWRRSLRRLRKAAPEIAGVAEREVEALIDEADRRAAAADLDNKPDAYRRWRERGEP